jgi:NAD(P)-dependent dehydrogenase (short-subunit alcohol dehydrogenase family)
MYLEKFRLSGKTAIVTGAAQGIGLACAEALSSSPIVTPARQDRRALAWAGRVIRSTWFLWT